MNSGNGVGFDLIGKENLPASLSRIKGGDPFPADVCIRLV
jgi:hypothetical protein